MRRPGKLPRFPGRPLKPEKEPMSYSDNPALRGNPDRERISLSQDYEVDYWTRKLGVSEEQLRTAISHVGNVPDKVMAYLNSNV